MARKVKDVTIIAEGRDKGKVFRLTELPADQTERWAIRVMNAGAKVPGSIPDYFLQAGIQGMTAIALSAFARADWHDIEPLLNEMFTCIQVVPSPSVVRPLIPDDIEEVATRIQLRREVLELHTGFFESALNWILTAIQLSSPPSPAENNMQNTQTSPASSPQ
jgi:hypothetical protein